MFARISFYCVLALLAIVFLTSGVSKAWTPDPAVRAVAFLLPVPSRALAVPVILVSLLATVEVSLGLALLASVNKRPPLIAAAGALACFSVALVVLAASRNAPRCGCIALPRALGAGQEAVAGLARNAALLGLICWLLRRSATAPRGDRLPSARRAGGFTLIELLVVIAIVATLVALALPALAGARSAAKLSRRVQTIRQLTASIAMYSADYSAMLPYCGTEGDPFGPITIHGYVLGTGEYFRVQRWFWASLVLPDYFDAPRASIEAPGRAEYMQQALGWPEFIVAADYQLTSTAFALPKFWHDDPSAPSGWLDFHYLRGTRLSDVTFPSSKGLLIADLTGPGGQDPGPAVPIGLADGSGRAVPRKTLDPARAVVRPFGASGFPIESTRDGIAGRDF